jgi:hypothetical protein
MPCIWDLWWTKRFSFLWELVLAPAKYNFLAVFELQKCTFVTPQEIFSFFLYHLNISRTDVSVNNILLDLKLFAVF